MYFILCGQVFYFSTKNNNHAICYVKILLVSESVVYTIWDIRAGVVRERSSSAMYVSLIVRPYGVNYCNCNDYTSLVSFLSKHQQVYCSPMLRNKQVLYHIDFTRTI